MEKISGERGAPLIEKLGSGDNARAKKGLGRGKRKKEKAFAAPPLCRFDVSIF